MKYSARLVLLFFAVLMVASSLSSFAGVQKASAASGPCWFQTTAGPVTGTSGCSVWGWGSYGTNDVLTGRSTSGSGTAIDGWVNSKPDFIQMVKNRFNSSNTQDRVGAAFIIQTMRGERTWPSNADYQNWIDRMQDSSIHFERTTRNIYKTSWYDPGKHNDFYDNYPAGDRQVVRIYGNGTTYALIEVACGNLANDPTPLPKAWGNMQADSTVDNPNPAPGDTVTWTHHVWDDGSVGNDDTPTVSGDVYWGTGTSVLVNSAYRVGSTYPAQVQPDKSYSRGFSQVGKANGVTRNYPFTIPDNANNGDTYCQFINGNKTSSSDASNFRSAGACVTVSKPATVKPSIKLDPNDLSPGQATAIKATIANNSSATAYIKSATVTIWYDNSSLNNNFTNAPGQQLVSGPVSWIGPNANKSLAQGANVSNTYPGTANGSFTYICARLDAAGAGTTTVTPSFDKKCALVTNKPFLSVINGDVIAGVSPSDGLPTCPAANSSADITAWNTGSGTWPGAGAQLAVQAMGMIDGFVSAQGTNQGQQPPNGLSFANTADKGTYGGDFGSVDGVNCDFTSDLGAPDATTATTLSAMPAQNTLYVKDADVSITGNLVFANNSWTDVSQIPSFRLVVVGGNIYINGGSAAVTQLHGIYVAEPDTSSGSPVGGTIYTCADGFAAKSTSDTDYYSFCNHPLNVYGAFVANEIRFGRTSGNYTTAGSAAAETFTYGPETWLGGLTSGDLGGTSSVTGLPPIL